MKYLIVLLSLIALTLAAPLKFAYIYDGIRGDVGWTFSHDQARIKFEATNNGEVTTAFYESVGYGDPAMTKVAELVSQNFSIIAFSSSAYAPTLENVSGLYPETFFIILGDAYTLKGGQNVGSVDYKMHQGGFLSGILAGIETKTNHIGFVTSYPSKFTHYGINSFFIGARLVNKDAQVHVIYIRSWHNETTEARAAEVLIEQYNCDIISQHTDSYAPMLEADSHGQLGIGFGSDMGKFVGPSVMTSVIMDWSAALQYMYDHYKAGNYTNTNVTRILWGVQEELVTLTPFSSKVNKTNTKYSIYEENYSLLMNGTTEHIFL